MGTYLTVLTALTALLATAVGGTALALLAADRWGR